MTALEQAVAGPVLTDRIELELTGMTCAACAARIEKKLNRLDGVSASVNYATEKAAVSFDEAIDPAELIAQVEAAGYQARLPRPAGVAGNAEPDPVDPTAALRTRLLVSTALTIPVVAMAGSLAAKKRIAESSGTFPVDGPLFTALLVGVLVVVVALTYFPALALGPVVEQLQMAAGTSI